MPERTPATCRPDFPALARRHHGRPLAFLDGPAGSQVPRPVIDAVTAYYERSNANTHGAFATSEETDALVAEARAAAAAFLGAPDPACVSFGANMTTLAFALARAFAREIRPGDEVVVTQLDHEGNRGPWLTLAERGAVVREVRMTSDGVLDEADLEASVTERTRLVAVGLASNALGTVNNTALAARAAHAVGARLVLDGVHYAPHFAVDVAALDADVLLCSAYKFYGPHVGLLYCRPGLLDALETDRLRTQDQRAPWRIETGTLNHAALAGVMAAIEYVASFGDGADLRARIVSGMAAIGAHERALAGRFAAEVGRLSGVRVWGPPFADGVRRAPTVSITIDGVTAQAAARALAAEGLCVWDGDFYAVRAVEVLGLAERGGLLRTGVLAYNTAEEIDRLLDGVGRLARGAA